MSIFATSAMTIPGMKVMREPASQTRLAVIVNVTLKRFRGLKNGNRSRILFRATKGFVSRFAVKKSVNGYKNDSVETS